MEVIILAVSLGFHIQIAVCCNILPGHPGGCVVVAAESPVGQ